jgi:Zn-dependent metalloprotease
MAALTPVGASAAPLHDSSRQAQPAQSTPSGRAAAAGSAAKLIASKPAVLKASKHDAFKAGRVLSSMGLNYVPYERTYRGIPVVGGDFVVATDDTGKILATSVAQTRQVRLASMRATVSRTAARATSGRVLRGSTVGKTRLVVLQTKQSRLAWETWVTGRKHGEASRLTVYVDARSGRVLTTKEHVLEGTGNGNWEGTVSIPTSGSGSSYSMTNSNASTLKCQNASGNTTFTGTDDVWGNGSATDRETGCVDAFYSAEKMRQMMSSWLGRNGMNGSGGWVPIRVGLNDVNAYYDGTQVQIGHTQSGGKWIGSIDVVAHEFGHGVDDRTPGGISGGGTQEFVGDTFGAATEYFANNPADVPDFTVGEEINLVGQGPIRVMYNPSAVGDSNCYSSSIPNQEVHAAAGPGNHWFYLMAMGSNPGGGNPTSPTCNGSTVTGIGIQKAQQVMYNAMLLKTSSSSYLKYRTWTLTAAKNLFPGSCTQFNTVKAAWDAVSVPAQSADPTCTSGTPSPTPSVSPTGNPGGCSGQKLANPGFESGATSWTATSGVIGQNGSSGQPTHGGTWNAWLDGYGRTHTDTLSQSVTIPAGCHATFTFWLHIDTAETTTSTQFDKLTVQAGTTTLGTFSNLNKAAGYTQRTFDVSSFAGQTVTLKFTGTEDSSLQTSFVVDDTAVTLS